MHGDATGDIRQEREADAFAAEFLTSAASIVLLLLASLDLTHLGRFVRII
ncbi:hypothetical protein [Streptomyces sp. V1I1]|nr:hypothetical protein [Streptomyces sp. V1I1]